MKARVMEDSRFGGFYDQDFIDMYYDQVINGVLVSEWIMTDILPNPSQYGYYDMRFNGTVWYEAADPAFIKAKKIEYNMPILQGHVVDMRTHAKTLAINKSGSEYYVFSQVDLYQRKYENAIAVIPIQEIDSDLEAEGLRDFNMTLPQFKSLIISMYESGKEKENLLISFSEQIRSAILTFMDVDQWGKVDSAFGLILQYKNTTNVDDARVIKDQILLL